MADPPSQPQLGPEASSMDDPDHIIAPPFSSTDPALDADLEMEYDTGQDPQTQHGQATSSSTLDHESTTQADTQQQQQQQQEEEQLQEVEGQLQGGGSSSHGPPPSRKDASLREFLSKMDDYAPIIPDAVTAHYLTVSGLPPPNPADPTGTSTNATPLPLARLLALATQKFIADIAADAYQYSRIRASNTAASSASSNAVAAAAAANMPGAVGAQAGAVAAGAAGAAGGGGGGGEKGRGGAGAGGPQLGVARAGYGGGGMGGSGQGRTVLTMEDLGMAVGEYGVNVRRGEFYR